MQTIVTQHVWVKHVITPVAVLDDGSGDPIVFVDPDEQTMAEESAVYGCGICYEPMATAFNTDCEGPTEE